MHSERDYRFTPTGVGTIDGLNGVTTTIPVHPHGRGDNVNRSTDSIRSNGSPPRAWGQYQAVPAGGSITLVHPHGRGDNSIRRAAIASLPVHPHGRGDNCGAGRNYRQCAGSPPRAWGQWNASQRR